VRALDLGLQKYANTGTEDDNQQIVLAHINNEFIKNARLEEENARLKTLLQRQNFGKPTPAEELEASTAEATVSVEEFRCLTDKYDDLNKRYQEAAQRIKYLERKNVAVMQKNKEMKENVRAWQEYCDRHIWKQKTKTETETKTETKPYHDVVKPLAVVQAHDTRPVSPSSPMPAALRTPHSVVDHYRSSPAPMMPIAHATFLPSSSSRSQAREVVSPREQVDKDAAQEREEQELPPVPEDTVDSRMKMGPTHINVAFLGRPGSDHLGSSQTTVDDVAEQNNAITKTTTPAEDDDVPQFMTERSLRRKRKRSTGLRTHRSSDGTPARPIRVKEEMFSSPPPQDVAVQLLRKETFDLDELGPNAILSPRRRLNRNFSTHSNLTGTLRNQRSSSAPFSGPVIKAEQSAEDVQIASPDETEAEAQVAAETRSISETGAPVRIVGDILQPLDPNGPHRANAGTPNKRIKREGARHQDAFNILAESGETPPPVDENNRRSHKLALAHYHQRLRANKNTDTPAKTSHSTPKTAPAKTTAAQRPTPPPTRDRSACTPSARPAQRKLPTSEPRPETRSDAHADHRPMGPVWSMAPPSGSTRKAPVAPSLQPVPLRGKQLAELTTHDFKPNPNYNQGYTHAFSETVRKRGDRLCLPGCTKSTCCGSTFRTLASAAAPLTPSQEETLLHDYLGDAYDNFGMTQMSQEERDEVVLQARTRQMAKEHGKHRQAYEGRRSPPGFWRVGFPSTQEQEEDRERALQMQQEMAKERYLEAMRNGKWMFRDE